LIYGLGIVASSVFTGTPGWNSHFSYLYDSRDYREEFKESFPMSDEARYFIRKPKAIEDLVNHVATNLG
jgi:hypothetical protein